MVKKLIMKVDEESFEAHVKRICRRNTKTPCKICVECPIKEYVLEVMNKYGWKYHGSLD